MPNRMIELHSALEIIGSTVIQQTIQEVDLLNGLHFVLAEDIYSDSNMPPFDKSAMDGYACRKSDLASPLLVIGVIYAGSQSDQKILPNSCIRIMTGAKLPEGADWVVMLEDTIILDENQITVKSTNNKSNICKMGEDVSIDKLLIPAGTLIKSHHLAILAAAGYYKFKVYKKPKITICCTGSELVEPAENPADSKIRNTNAYNLYAQICLMGIEPVYSGILADNKDLLSQKIKELTEQCDLLIITGGASQGDHDYIPEILKEMEYGINFSAVAIQPGKPVSFAYRKQSFVFGLSGNPVSSLLQFELLVKPFLYHFMHHKYNFNIFLATMSHTYYRKNVDRLLLLPIKFNEIGEVVILPFNGSAHITGLINFAGFALIPLNCNGFNEGEKVEILLMN